jgi:hypothetical protein
MASFDIWHQRDTDLCSYRKLLPFSLIVTGVQCQLINIAKGVAFPITTQKPPLFWKYAFGWYKLHLIS